MYTLSVDGSQKSCSGSILEEIQAMGKNPDSYLYLIGGMPVPMDSVPDDGRTVECIRVASGG